MTTPCPTDETLSRFAEGTLEAEAARALGEHSEVCESCHGTLVALAKLRSAGSGGDRPSLDEDESITAGVALGRYVVSRRVGAGAMGVVFEAFDPALRRKVAVKLLRGPTNERLQARLQREAQTMARVSHRNVAMVYDVGTYGHRGYIAMEFIDGQTLRQWLASAKRAPDDLARVLAQAGAGLEAAHRQGVVHRDFKPDNVLVERDGRVVVTDFGLSSSDLEPSGGSSGAAHHTQTAGLLGTPAYMAPELFEAGGATPRSDQFSFCVTAVEAFSGQRPFQGDTLEALAASVRAGLRDASLVQVPPALRRALARGLRVEPSERFDSMAQLLAQLAPAPKRSLLLGVAALLLGVVGAGWWWNRAQVCSGAKEVLAPAWGPTARAAVHAAFAAGGAAALGSEGVLTAAVDRWAQQWQQTWVDACEATRVRGEQSPELLELRMACLKDRVDDLRSLSELFAAGDAQVLAQAPTIARQLPDLAVCSEEKSLRAPVRPPSARVREQVEAQRAQIHGLLALRAAGRWRELDEPTQALVRDAEETGYAPFSAEALLLRAEVQAALGDASSATQTLHRAIVAAETGGHARLAAQAWALTVRIEGKQLAHYPEAHRASALAQAIATRLGAPPELEAGLAQNDAAVACEEGQHGKAEAQLTRALGLQQKVEPDSLACASTLDALGSERLHQSDLQGAVAHHQRALSLLRAKLPEPHPDLARALKSVGNDYWTQGKLDDALEWYSKALAMHEQVAGPDSLDVSSARNNVAAVLVRLQKLPEAEAALREVLRVEASKRGEVHPALFPVLNNLAIVLRYTNRLDEAQAVLERALAIVIAAHGEAHGDVATTLINIGDTQLARRDFKGSAQSYRRAAAITEQTAGAASPDLADCYAGLAYPLLELRDVRGAFESATRALAIYRQTPGIPLVEAAAHVVHARAWWQLEPARRREARAEMVASRASMVTAGAQVAELAEVDEWLKAHP